MSQMNETKVKILEIMMFNASVIRYKYTAHIFFWGKTIKRGEAMLIESSKINADERKASRKK